MPCPSRLTSKNDPIPNVWRLGGALWVRLGWCIKSCPYQDLILTVQPLLSHYTDYTIPVHNEMVILNVSLT